MHSHSFLVMYSNVAVFHILRVVPFIMNPPPELISVFLLAVKVSNQWRPVVTGSGHFDAVEDLEWETGGGQFVVSVSKDQTTRLHAPTTYKQGQVCISWLFSI